MQTSTQPSAIGAAEATGAGGAQASAGPAIPWTSLVFFAALFAISYFGIFRSLVEQWIADEDASHGFFVPVISAAIAWGKRQEILGLPWKPNYSWGLLAVLWGSVQLVIGSLGAELFLQRTSFIILLAGGILLMGGWRVLKACGLPLFVLLFMIPLPKVVYGGLTLPLQLFASEVAENVLLLAGIPVLRDGNIIELATTKLSVVEACSGIRSLISLAFVGITYGYFFDEKPWMKWALLAGTVPIAVAANAARVTITGMIADKNPELVQGLLHTAEGWVIFVVDLALLIALHTLINWVWKKWGRASKPPLEEAPSAT